MNRTLIENVRFVTPINGQETGCIGIEDEKIALLGELPQHPENWQCIDGKRAWLLPAFIDLHIHGMGGFGPEQGSPEALLQMSNVLAKQGVQAFCPTLYCAKPAQMAALLKHLIHALGKEKGAKILGFHLEGPFISPAKPGVMKPGDISPANLADFIQLYEAAQGNITIVTLAPELPGIDPIIQFCLSHHIIVQAGHTNATYEQMQAAFDKGVRRVTHLANAMRGFHHREPGTLGAVLANPNISCEIIADGHHLHPAVLTLLRQVKPISQITAVTDALLPTQQARGPFYANGEEVVLEQGVWKRKADAVMAGSALTMVHAFAQLVTGGYSLAQAYACTSHNAAHLVGLAALLQPNQPANLVLLSHQLTLQNVYLQGKKI